MTNRSEKIAVHVTPEFKTDLEEVAEKNSLSISEILRRGAIHEMEVLG